MPQLYCQTTAGVFATVCADPADHLEQLRQVHLDPESGGHGLYPTITFAGVLQSEEPPTLPLLEIPEPLAPWTLSDYVVEEPA